MLVNFKSIRDLFNKHKMNYLLIAAIFHLSLFFSSSNKVTLFFSIIYLLVLFKINKNLKFSVFLVFISLLPFAKGKALEISILSKEQINRFALFDISYYFPIYISDFYLFLLAYLHLRQKISQHHQNQIKIVSQKSLILASFSFGLFLVIGLLNALINQYQNVVFLSTVQLVKLFILFFLSMTVPVHLKNRKEIITDILFSSVVFQSIWAILQSINGGYLGKDLEVYLRQGSRGVVAAENPNQIRATGTFFEPSILGTFLLMHLSLFSFIILEKRLTKKKKKLYLGGISLVLIAMILTGSRALYGLTFLYLLLIVYRYRDQINQLKPQLNFQKIFKPIQIIALVLFSCLVVITIPFLLQRLKSLPTLFTSDGSAMYRIQLNVYAIKLAFKYFLGSGLNLSPYHLVTAFPNDDYFFDPAHPHNVFFQILAETGVLGLSFFFFFVYFIFRPVILNKENLNRFTIGALLFLICAQVYPIFLNHPEILSYFFLYSGLHYQKKIKS